MKKFLTVLGVLCVLVAAVGLIYAVAKRAPDEPDAAELAQESDASVEEHLSGEAADDARDWLSRPGNRLYEGDPAYAQGVITDLLTAGAAGVWFVGVERNDAGENVADEIAIRLPEDPKARAAVFAVYDSLWDDETTPDVGQEYLTYVFDEFDSPEGDEEYEAF